MHKFDEIHWVDDTITRRNTHVGGGSSCWGPREKTMGVTSQKGTYPPMMSLLSLEKAREKIQKLLSDSGWSGRASWICCSPKMFNKWTGRRQWDDQTYYYFFKYILTVIIVSQTILVYCFNIVLTYNVYICVFLINYLFYIFIYCW